VVISENLADGRGDHLDRADRFLRLQSAARDLDADLVGGLRGLGGQCFHFLRDHRDIRGPLRHARAASIVALSASKLVCSATEVINLMTSPMRLAACEQCVDAGIGFIGCRTALAAIELDSWTCCEISRTEIASSSVAEGRPTDVVGGVFGGIGDHGGEPRGVAGVVAERARGAFQLARCRRQ